GTTVEDSERFCSECGTPILTTTTTPAPAVTPAQPVQTQPQQTAYAVSASGAPPLGLGATAPFEATRVSGQPISSSMAPKIIVGVVAAVLVLVVIVSLVMRTGGASVEKKLDDAIARKNLFG